jgi:hypothetical protein
MNEWAVEILRLLYDKGKKRTRAFIDGKGLHEAVLHRRPPAVVAPSPPNASKPHNSHGSPTIQQQQRRLEKPSEIVEID